MCTGFVKYAANTLFAYNLDIDPSVWNYNKERYL